MIFVWSQSWQMWFNVNKCVTLRCNRSSQSFFYLFSGQCIPQLCKRTFLPIGVLLTSSMSFSPHINNIVAKASKMLIFIR